MFPYRKYRARRVEIRKARPDAESTWWRRLTSRDVMTSLAIAVAFCLLAILIVTMRDPVRYRPGQYTQQDILSRVNFQYQEPEELYRHQQAARDAEPRVYKARGDFWADLKAKLKRLPDQLAGKTIEQVPDELREQLGLDSGSLTQFQSYQEEAYRPKYDQWVDAYVNPLKTLIILNAADRNQDLPRTWIVIPPRRLEVNSADIHVVPDDKALVKRIEDSANKAFLLPLPKTISRFTLSHLQPTHEYDDGATQEARRHAAERISPAQAVTSVKANQVLVPKGVITERSWRLLQAEQGAFVRSLGRTAWKREMGMAGLVIVLTIGLGAYIGRYQPKLLRNHERAVALAALLLSMLLLAELAAVESKSLFIFGVAPTLLVATILAIVYDQRFAQGVAAIHAMLVTASLDQGIGFFVILWVGAVTACFVLRDIRSRSRLIEVGGMMAVTMSAATVVVGGLSYDPISHILINCMYVGAAGLGVGFIVLGILPFIERMFRITTSMTLLELADASQPLLKRLALEVPGTYNHSLLVATLSEAAGESIGANSLLCRVGAYYHDIGKMAKPDYFVENQTAGRNRHHALSPSVSLLIIHGHVKDGLELAREYNLPTVLFPFIQSHHGTTLVEYFYHQAKVQKQSAGEDGEVDDTQYRYSGPKPRNKEVAIVMLADAVEGAARAMVEPTPARIEAIVHELSMKRLLDGQFDDSGLSFTDLKQMERSMIKTMQGIYHGRMAYPSTVATTHGPLPATKTA